METVVYSWVFPRLPTWSGLGKRITLKWQTGHSFPGWDSLLASGTERFGFLQLVGRSIFTLAIMGAQTPSDPKLCSLGPWGNNSSRKRAVLSCAVG